MKFENSILTHEMLPCVSRYNQKSSTTNMKILYMCICIYKYVYYLKGFIVGDLILCNCGSWLNSLYKAVVFASNAGA